MATMRTKAELDVLRAEAERRVRAGESRAEVSRALGVHLQTLAEWALRFGWRQKDLEAERREELVREAETRLEALKAREAETTDAAVEATEAAGAPAAGGDPVARAMATADRYLGENRLGEAERASSVAMRISRTMERMRALGWAPAEKQGEAADGLPLADWVPYDPERDPKWRERTEMRSRLDDLIARCEADIAVQMEAKRAARQAELAEGRCPVCSATLDAATTERLAACFAPSRTPGRWG